MPASPPPAPPTERPRDVPEPVERQYHAEPRENVAAHEPAPIAHFEPTPRPEPGAPPAKPYVVWTSAPEKDGGRGPEE